MNETKEEKLEQLVEPEGKQSFRRGKPILTAREIVELGSEQRESESTDESEPQKRGA